MLSLHHFFNQMWYHNHWLRKLLMPVSWLYSKVVQMRRYYLQRWQQEHIDVPVIVVGNVTVGGVGKTPLVIALAQALQAKGIRVGVVSRGYGARRQHYPYAVGPEDNPAVVGDEPALIARKANCPVVIDPKRTRAASYLMQHYQPQVIISDDGLQHYHLARSLEIIVIDGIRGLGNGLCLPAGPLRELPHRLQEADLVVVNGSPNEALQKLAQQMGLILHKMELIPQALHCFQNNQAVPILSLSTPIAAVAGIGHPERFFATLSSLGIQFTPYIFADHHAFVPEDFIFPEKNIVMTEKDAVKCLAFTSPNMYFLPVVALVCDKFWETLWSHVALQ